MTRLTKIELVQKNSELAGQNAALRAQNSVLQAQLDELRSRAPVITGRRAVLIECQRIAKELGATARINVDGKIEAYRAGKWEVVA